MRVRMRQQMSGTRDGADWPLRGEELDVTDDEGAALCAAGIADPMATEPPVERADTPPAETRSTTRRAGR